MMDNKSEEGLGKRKVNYYCYMYLWCPIIRLLVLHCVLPIQDYLPGVLPVTKSCPISMEIHR